MQPTEVFSWLERIEAADTSDELEWLAIQLRNDRKLSEAEIAQLEQKIARKSGRPLPPDNRQSAGNGRSSA